MSDARPRICHPCEAEYVDIIRRRLAAPIQPVLGGLA